MIRAALTAIALCTLSTAAHAQSLVSELRDTMLERHNAARAEKGARPLGWSDALAADAARYAQELAATRTFDHADQSGQGENLFMGTRGAYAHAEMAQAWIDERAHYRPGQFPQVTRTGNWSDVGHYTQIVWPDTSEVGCAVASNAEDDYLVCRYFPAGNVVGLAMR